MKCFVKQAPQHLLCDKRGLHSEEPLDIICTNPLCRQNPIACSVCFDEKHKHHNVVSFSKFIDQFNRQSRSFDRKGLLPQIERIHKQAKSVCKELRKNINQKLDEYQKDIDIYADYLYDQLEQKNLIQKLINLNVTSQRMTSTINLSELRESLKYVLNNSKFNGEGEMSTISAPLKESNEKIQSLISKLEYVSFNCLRRVQTELNNLRELRDTIDDVKRKDVKVVNSSGTPASKIRIEKRKPTQEDSTNVKKALDLSSPQKPGVSIKPFTTEFKTNHSPEEQQFSSSHQTYLHTYQPVKYQFTRKHSDLTLVKNILKSNVYGRQAHYAVATPSISNSPVSKWMIKILSCRDIYCTNSLAVGICHLSELKKKHFQSRVNDFQDAYLLSSSGDVLTPGDVSRNEEMKFKTGDILELQYDSYYKLLEIKNEHGNILSLKIEEKDNDPLFICARMTFLGDEIELINY